MTLVETATSRETLGPQELSKKARAAILDDVVPNLLRDQDVLKGIADTYFKRRFGHGGRRLTDDPILVRKGEGKRVYLLSFEAEPLRFSSEHKQIYDTTMRVDVEAYEPQGKELGETVGGVGLYTYFTEDQDGEVLQYRSGSVWVKDETGEYKDSDEAFEKIPNALKAFYPQPANL